ncbi:NAD(P)-dependent oxidoreductase [Solidesulfovibrio sp.]|uniref:NAD-dependent epimerase/dehydratase family protein n=1 Tax=Solidesulfovibrio sp. TaxID=2910990 RepID=UPI00263A04EE|nr:NAD(P)-dependent oxidoreductase [Solidesulfovibrio sp.]
MNILVTGGAGYKGIIIVQKLLDRGHHVVLMDNFMYGYDPVLHLVNNDNLDIVKHDIRNEIEGLHKFDGVIHLAGISGYPACEANPHSADLINVEATRRLVRALSPNQWLINASTTSFYGKSGTRCDETTPLDPVSMYGITKYRAEEIVNTHPQSVNLRFATVFGPSPKMRMDLMVNDFTYKAMKEGVVVLFDSYAKRTFIHVDDAAESYMFALDNWDKMVGGTFNAGGDNLNYSKKEIAELVLKYVNYNIIDSDIKDRDVRHFIISFDKIKSLGFVPKHTVEDGIKQLIKLYSFYTYYSHFKTI